MELQRAGEPLEPVERKVPPPGHGQVLIRVAACGVCRTDLHLVDGDLPGAKLPIIPGHQIVGRVAEVGPGALGFSPGDRVGVPWLGWTCGDCSHCRAGRENLCDSARFTGHDLDGGFADYAVADARYSFPLPDGPDDADLAPLLCAGVIGYRALRLAGEFESIGFFGFGSAAHLLAQMVVAHGRRLFAFTRPGDSTAQAFAERLGAVWSGGSDRSAPEELDAAVIFAPVGALVPIALRAVRKGGVVVCAGIHMSDIPAFPYATIWGERVLRSVANLTRDDARKFLELAAEEAVRAQVRSYPLGEANRALEDLRAGRFDGSAVLVNN